MVFRGGHWLSIGALLKSKLSILPRGVTTRYDSVLVGRAGENRNGHQISTSVALPSRPRFPSMPPRGFFHGPV